MIWRLGVEAFVVVLVVESCWRVGVQLLSVVRAVSSDCNRKNGEDGGKMILLCEGRRYCVISFSDRG